MSFGDGRCRYDGPVTVSKLRWGLLVIPLALAAFAGACGHDAAPTPPPLTVSLPVTVLARYTTCVTCTDGLTVVADVPVTVMDAAGPGGTLASVEVRVMNTSRGQEIARNLRPNADAPLIPNVVPAGGQIVVPTGIAFPAPPPRDALMVVATVTATDGREASASATLLLSD